MIKDKQHPKVGSNIKDVSVYEFDVYDFMCILDPPHGFDVPRIDPKDYFITSGDAIQKTIYLSRIMWEYAGKVRKQLNDMRKPSNAMIAFEKLCWKQAGAANKMLCALREAKGDAVFLETDWSEHTMYCVAKNPRPK